MAKKPESRLQKKIQDRLRSEVGGWWFKVWGGPFTPAGIPDLIGCVEGLFFAFEVKRPVKSSKPSEAQIETIDRIVEAGGRAQIVRSPEEAINAVVEAIAEAGKRRRVRYETKSLSTTVRAKNRKNIYHLGRYSEDDP